MKKPSLITVSLLGVVMLGLTAGLATAQVTTNLTAEADTYTRANVGAATAENLDVRGFGGGDFVGYVRFNLSSLPIETITSARFSLYRGVGSRNDTLVTGRFRNFGLTNASGNTPQNWDEATLVDTTVNVGAEYTSVGGNQVNPANLFNLDADLGANVTESVTSTLDAESYITGPDLVTFLTERLNDDGLATFINVINQSGRGYGFRSREHTNTAVLPTLTIEYLPATGLSNLTWATGSSTWDIGTTASWQDEVGGSKT